MNTVHRLLDEAFAGVEVTPELADLKEEMRADLMARAADLEAGGISPGDAAQRAFDELGDVPAVIAEVAGQDPSATTGPPTHSQLMAANKVRPKPAYVVSVVVASVVGAALVTLAALGLADVLSLATGAILGWLAGAALAVGWIVGASLVQETTTNHPMPPARALGYGAASTLAAFGLGLVAVVVFGDLEAWAYALAGLALVVAAAVFAGLGATQTNRKKAWVRELHRASLEHDRFEQDPAAAARFGIYTVVIWVLAFLAFVILGFTAGWLWALLSFVAAVAVTMLVLARMLFADRA